MDTNAERAVGDLVRRTMRRDKLPGVSVAVVEDDSVTFTDGFGSRDLAGNRPATPDTLYGVGSVTKSFTALAVLQLQESGMLSVEDPVTDHLDVELAEDAAEPVRLRHLLTHSSGYPSLGVSEALIARRLRRGTDTLPLSDESDFHAHLAGAADERAAPPGERFAYCNSGYTLLGEVIESCTGRPFDEYVASHVFDPLGMERATFDDTEFAMDDDHMTQYLRDEGELVAASLPVRERSRAAGGILTSVRELGDYLRLHLNAGEVDGTRLLPESSVRALHEGRVDTPSGPYGFGWRIRRVGDRDLVGHSGSIAVSSAYVGFCPAEGIGVAVAANAAPEYPLAHLGMGVFAAALGEDPAEAVPFFERRARFDRLTGEYASYKGIERAVVARDGGTLRLELGGALGGTGTPLVPVEDGGPHDFYALDDAGNREPAEFRADDGSGDVDLLYGRWRFHKVADAASSE
ncbi:serine hydrolase [Halorarum salinum]|uniref:Serine hydrolase n=1 Tax=Halorarum salinum TaxID=2743089 RepID=A0A7D5L8G2_9EURY|nr:serine hydrolase [Halobaculum salinum]QLG60474.1 serine hydrolase [Halobaculum salinum]